MVNRVVKELKNELKWTYDHLPEMMRMLLFFCAAMAFAEVWLNHSAHLREYLVGGIFFCAVMALLYVVEWLREPKRAP